GVREEALLQRARAAADTLFARLLERLNTEYQQGGAERGVQVCAQVAQSLTRQVGREQGVQIRRVSLKNRNPRNAPDAWERQVLQHWERDLKQGKEIGEVAEWRTERNGRVYRYMRPIKVAMPLCLECHGTQIKPEVRRLIRERYPNDKATGYQLGDLRGAFSVKIPQPKEVRR
ncbi:MAG: DUF3365 domain-containing protein, partial [Fimbriimonadales bacterium]